jgi:SAM-dependent methyltransferase
MKQLLKNIPLLGPLARTLKQRLFPAEAFTTSEAYWLHRYAQGGNSGAGSYHNLAEFKATVLNQFVAEHGINTVLELGCGDGNQLRYFRFPAYTGFDISPVVIAQCQALFKDDPSKQFFHVGEAAGHQADLALSLDVIYHLIEDDTYHAYMRSLFAAATSFVIIYSCDSDAPHNYAPHVRPRKFTTWVAQHRPDFRLLAHIPNQFPLQEGQTDSSSASFSDFFIYQKS